MTRKKPLAVWHRLGHLQPNFIVHISKNVTFVFLSIFHQRLVEYEDVELVDTEG